MRARPPTIGCMLRSASGWGNPAPAASRAARPAIYSSPRAKPSAPAVGAGVFELRQKWNACRRRSRFPQPNPPALSPDRARTAGKGAKPATEREPSGGSSSESEEEEGDNPDVTVKKLALPRARFAGNQRAAAANDTSLDAQGSYDRAWHDSVLAEDLTLTGHPTCPDLQINDGVLLTREQSRARPLDPDQLVRLDKAAFGDNDQRRNKESGKHPLVPLPPAYADNAMPIKFSEEHKRLRRKAGGPTLREDMLRIEKVEADIPRLLELNKVARYNVNELVSQAINTDHAMWQFVSGILEVIDDNDVADKVRQAICDMLPKHGTKYTTMDPDDDPRCTPSPNMTAWLDGHGDDYDQDLQGASLPSIRDSLHMWQRIQNFHITDWAGATGRLLKTRPPEKRGFSAIDNDDIIDATLQRDRQTILSKPFSAGHGGGGGSGGGGGGARDGGGKNRRGSRGGGNRSNGGGGGGGGGGRKGNGRGGGGRPQFAPRGRGSLGDGSQRQGNYQGQTYQNGHQGRNCIPNFNPHFAQNQANGQNPHHGGPAQGGGQQHGGGGGNPQQPPDNQGGQGNDGRTAGGPPFQQQQSPFQRIGHRGKKGKH